MTHLFTDGTTDGTARGFQYDEGKSCFVFCFRVRSLVVRMRTLLYMYCCVRQLYEARLIEILLLQNIAQNKKKKQKQKQKQ